MPFMWTLWLCRGAQTSAAVLLAGTSMLRLLARGTNLENETGAWRQLAFGSWCALSVAGAFQLLLTASSMSNLPLAEACSPEVLADVLGSTRFGAVWQVQAGLLAGIGFLLTTRRFAARRESTPFDVVLALLSAAFLVTLVWAGHAHASNRSAWLLPSDALHVLAAGAWPGGLLPLGWLLIQARRDSVLIPAAITITRRFSRVSVVAVGILAFSGLLSSCGLVEAFPALWSSFYGRLLLGKAALFASMVYLGALNRKLIPPTSDTHHSDIVARLWRNVSWECGLAIAVLLMTEALAMNAPPAGG